MELIKWSEEIQFTLNNAINSIKNHITKKYSDFGIIKYKNESILKDL